GPGWDQMFVQSNFGVVTKMGMWLMPEPESLMGMDVEFDRPEDLKAMVDTIGPLRRERVLQQSPSIGNWLRAAAVATTRDEWTDKPGALDDHVIDAIRKRFGLGWWGVSLRLYGREEVNKAAYKVLEKAMNDIKTMAIKPTTWVKGQPLEYSGWTGTPITFPMQNANWYGGRGGHIGFSPIIPQDGTKALEQFQRTYARYKEFGMDYQGSFAFGERHLTNVNAMIFNKDDPAMMAKVDPFFRQLVVDAKAQGDGEYRRHLDYMDLVAQTYDWNGGSLWRLNETVKDALDPNGILAPGKNGIWPKGRGTRAGAGAGGDWRSRRCCWRVAPLPGRSRRRSLRAQVHRDRRPRPPLPPGPRRRRSRSRWRAGRMRAAARRSTSSTACTATRPTAWAPGCWRGASNRRCSRRATTCPRNT